MLNVGDTTDLTHIIRDATGDLADPATLMVDIYAPSATLTGDDPDDPTTITYEPPAPGDPGSTQLVRVEEGVFRLLFVVDEAGAWQVRWRSTTPDDVRTADLWVTPSVFDTAPTTGVTPTVAEVAAILLDRRVDAFGRDQRTFTSDTVPSAMDAEAAILRASRIVLASLGPALTETGVSAQATPLARDCIAHRAAMSLVMFLPEPEPEYERLRLEFDALMVAFGDLLRGQTPKARGLVVMDLISPWSGDDYEHGDILA